tara:strand:- start:484 stop:813 length:330 start_codon:yes stop_codon:yes gene_type:complete
MSEAIDRVRAHFDSISKSKRIEVPEWEMTIFSSPVTLSEKNRLFKKGSEGNLELLVDVLVMKACDETGKKMFDISDRPTFLNHADSTVIGRVAAEIMDSNSPKGDELKN